MIIDDLWYPINLYKHQKFLMYNLSRNAFMNPSTSCFFLFQ